MQTSGSGLSLLPAPPAAGAQTGVCNHAKPCFLLRGRRSAASPSRRCIVYQGRAGGASRLPTPDSRNTGSVEPTLSRQGSAGRIRPTFSRSGVIPHSPAGA